MVRGHNSEKKTHSKGMSLGYAHLLNIGIEASNKKLSNSTKLLIVRNWPDKKKMASKRLFLIWKGVITLQKNIQMECF